MNSKSIFKKFKWLILLAVAISAVYGMGRLYYNITDGFTIGNITSDFAYDPRWEVTPLRPEEKVLVGSILDQKFSYLGKGCQSYVFLSQDGKYVLKFFKYQRFRTKPWVDFFSFIPSIDRYRLKKLEKKRLKLEGFIESWKIAYNELKHESGLLFVHLNKTNHLNKTLNFTDKMGMAHQVNLDEMEFMIQHKATMLDSTIKKLMAENKVEEAKSLLKTLIELITSENHRGLADNDHALMQNTGVYDGRPIHVDVGQFLYNDQIRNPATYKQELFNKTYRFHRWLEKHYPELADYLTTELVAIIGNDFYKLEPYFKPHD